MSGSLFWSVLSISIIVVENLRVNGWPFVVLASGVVLALARP